jgi:hypothetical protein
MAPHPAVDPDSSLWGWLAYDLRFYRERSGMSLARMGRIIRRSATNLSNCEAGRRRITSKEAKALDAHFNTGGHFQRLLRFAQLGHDPNWLKQYIDLEKSSTRVKTFQALVVPGLLQLPEYALALFREGGEVSDPEAMAAERIKRQAILDDSPPPQLWALTTESVLEWPVGGREVMRKQLTHLLEMSERDNVSIRVVPKATGAYPGLAGSFSIISSDLGEIAYTDSPGGGRLVPSTPEVESFGNRYDRIGHVALPTGLSRQMIERAREAL